MAQDIAEHAEGVDRLLRVEVTQGQFDALVSFTFNFGVRALADSTLLKRVNAGRMDDAADEILRWVHVDGKENRGLKRRRVVERALFETGELPPLVA